MREHSKRYFGLVMLLSLFFSIALSACKEKKTSYKSTSKTMVTIKTDVLRKLIESNPIELDSLDIFNTPASLRLAYINSQYQPYWVNDAPSFNKVKGLLSDINRMPNDGLSIDRYHLKDIKNKLDKIKNNTATEEELAIFDTICTHSYLLAARELLVGRIKPVDVDTEWLHINDTSWTAVSKLSEGLENDNRYSSLSLYKSKLTAYKNLKKERRKYRQLQSNIALRELNNGEKVTISLKSEMPVLHPEMLENKDAIRAIIEEYYEVRLTGAADSIETYQLAIRDSIINKIDVNLERLRWLPQEFEDAYLVVNVPAMNLYLNIDNKDTMHMKVVIGKRSRATPTMTADMVNIVFNPTWTVPPGIMRKDIIPGINKKGAAYLEKKGLAIFTHGGKPLNLDSISVTKFNFKKYVFRQPPGYRNALGRVKFNLPNKHNIYLHDTPSRSDFRKKKRAKSSGCIRVQHPRDMAGYILTKINKEANSKRFVDSIINKNKMIFVPLEKRIPVHILYLTATEDSAKQHVVYLDDVYKKDEAIAQLLK